jgi:hypothetical protein
MAAAEPTTTTITSHCLCNANTFSLTIPASQLPLDHAHFCHCTSCRHATGTLALSIVTWPGPLPPLDSSKITTFAISDKTNTYHCSTCGTLLFEQTTDPDEPDEDPWVGVATGTLDNAASWCRFTAHTFVPDTKDGGSAVWVDEVKGVQLKRYTEWEMPGQDALLKEGWIAEVEKKAMEAPETREGEADELHASCKCGGVQFKVTRPTEASRE